MNMALLCTPFKYKDSILCYFFPSDSKKFQHVNLWIFVLVKRGRTVVVC
jgi:hypothetical protein